MDSFNPLRGQFFTELGSSLGTRRNDATHARLASKGCYANTDHYANASFQERNTDAKLPGEMVFLGKYYRQRYTLDISYIRVAIVLRDFTVPHGDAVVSS